MSSGGAESGTAPIQVMVVAARPGYPGYKGGAGSSRGGGGYRYRIIRGIGRGRVG